MRSRSGGGQRERVLAARRQARVALGKDPDGGDLFAAPPAGTPITTPTPAATPAPSPVPRGPVEYGLFLGEAATRLNMSRAELEVMIATGKLEALPCGLTRMIPTREIERLLQAAR